MTRLILLTTARGIVGLGICFGFGWSLSNVLGALTRHMDKTPMRPVA